MSILDIIKQFEEKGITPSSFAGPNGIKFELVTGRFSGTPRYVARYPEYYDFSRGIIGGDSSTEIEPEDLFKNMLSSFRDSEIPTVDPFSGQQVSAQDQEVIENINKKLDYLKSLDPNYLVPGSAGGMVLEDAIARQQETLNDILNKYTNQPTNFPTIDPFSGRPYLTDPNAPVQPVGPAPPDNYYDEVPTVDPFSGEQVSAQDQAAFTQQQDIFPEQSRGLDYLTGMPDSQPVSQLGRQGILNLLTSNFGDLDFQTINELRNNPDAFNLSRGSGALTAGSLLPKFIKDFQYAAPQGTDINQLRNLARETASNKSFTDLIKDVYNDPAKFDPDFKPKKAGQIKTGYPQYLKEGILSAVGFQPTSQIGGGTDAARALLEKIKSIPGAQTLGKVLPGVGIASGTYDVGSRLSQGDYFGAGLGALSAVPFVGIPAAAAQAAYDYRQPLADMIRNVVYRPGRG